MVLLEPTKPNEERSIRIHKKLSGNKNYYLMNEAILITIELRVIERLKSKVFDAFFSVLLPKNENYIAGP